MTAHYNTENQILRKNIENICYVFRVPCLKFWERGLIAVGAQRILAGIAVCSPEPHICSLVIVHLLSIVALHTEAEGSCVNQIITGQLCVFSFPQYLEGNQA